ncbi:MAG: 2-oxoglutarate dehydrogenase E1 component, partial [Pseudomonadota bacterium]|nr:2-oxoglutarate dehydrogenase E1 component [Pseudomonadota bacterium]
MARQETNEAFQQSSFLYGGNAGYLEDLHARFQENPASVDAEWRAFFAGLKDQKTSVLAEARGPTWQRGDWPIHANGEIVSAFDCNWAPIERQVGDKVKAVAQARGGEVSDGQVFQATRDSVRALMMIRAYRMRGHLHADLDPLGLAKKGDHEELHPSTYGFEEADCDRKIFIDNVLGIEFATIREMLEILRRTYCSTLGVEFMHISEPHEK